MTSPSKVNSMSGTDGRSPRIGWAVKRAAPKSSSSPRLSTIDSWSRASSRSRHILQDHPSLPRCRQRTRQQSLPGGLCYSSRRSHEVRQRRARRMQAARSRLALPLIATMYSGRQGSMVSAKAAEQVETRERRTGVPAEENGQPGGVTAVEQAARDHVWIHQLPWAEFE